jgi:hypothetical protein
LFFRGSLGAGHPLASPVPSSCACARPELLVLNAGFVALFLGSACLFQRGAHGRLEPAASDA